MNQPPTEPFPALTPPTGASACGTGGRVCFMGAGADIAKYFTELNFKCPAFHNPVRASHIIIKKCSGGSDELFNASD
jgi:hypothetical protein